MATKLSVSLPKTEITFSGVRSNESGRLRIRQNYLDWLPTGHKAVYRVSGKSSLSSRRSETGRGSNG